MPSVEAEDFRHVLSPLRPVLFPLISPFGSLAIVTKVGKVGRFGSRSEPRSHESGSAEVVKLSDYLRISEAAEYLGVSPNTLRNWVNAGKIAAIRHPVNGYRLFKREDLDALLKQVETASRKASKK
jgi:excisionase family DNA binding protein